MGNSIYSEVFFLSSECNDYFPPNNYDHYVNNENMYIDGNTFPLNNCKKPSDLISFDDEEKEPMNFYLVPDVNESEDYKNKECNTTPKEEEEVFKLTSIKNHKGKIKKNLYEENEKDCQEFNNQNLMKDNEKINEQTKKNTQGVEKNGLIIDIAVKTEKYENNSKRFEDKEKVNKISLNILSKENIVKTESKLFSKNDKLNDLLIKYINIFVFEGIEEKHKRLYSCDNLLKKIKTIFFKFMIVALNKRLKRKNIDKNFKRLEQAKISNVSIKNNKILLEMTLKKMIKEKPSFKDKSLNKKKVEGNWKNNVEILDYLENIGDEYFNEIFNLSMEELFNDYLISKEFENSIVKLEEKYKYDYIQKYILTADHLVNYYKTSTI